MKKSITKLSKYDYCEWERTPLFGHSFPLDDYFNDNLDHFYDEDDYFDYDDHPELKTDAEDNEYSYSHKTLH